MPQIEVDPSQVHSIEVDPSQVSAAPPDSFMNRAAREVKAVLHPGTQPDAPIDNQGFWSTVWTRGVRPIAEQIADTFNRGDFGEHAVEETLSSLSDQLKAFTASGGDIRKLPILGPHSQATADDMQKQIDAGNYRGAAGSLVSFLAPYVGPGLLKEAPGAATAAKDAVIDRIPAQVTQTASAVRAGVKAAAPDVAAGTAKAAIGAGVSEMLPGGPLKYVVGAKPVYSGATQIARGMAKGFRAGREAFRNPPVDPAEFRRTIPVTDDGPSPMGTGMQSGFGPAPDTRPPVETGGGHIPDYTWQGETPDQFAARMAAEKAAANPSAAPATPAAAAAGAEDMALLDGLAYWSEKKPFSALKPDQQAAIRRLAGNGNTRATPQGAPASAAPAPTPAQALFEKSRDAFDAEKAAPAEPEVQIDAPPAAEPPALIDMAPDARMMQPPELEAKARAAAPALPYPAASIPGEHVLNARALPATQAGNTVDGLTVRSAIPDTGSISASFSHSDELPGVREVPFSIFENPGPGMGGKLDARTLKLAEQIRDSGEINPLIVAVDHKGPYILEGGHRFDALSYLGKKSFPGLVVLDRDSLGAAADTGLADAGLKTAAPEPAPEPPPIAAEQPPRQGPKPEWEPAFDFPPAEPGAPPETPPERSNRYQKANRTVKARALANRLFNDGKTPEYAAALTTDEWYQLAEKTNVNKPSETSIAQAIDELRGMIAKSGQEKLPGSGTAAAPAPAPAPALAAPGEPQPGDIRMMNPRDIVADPVRFQFKRDTGAGGIGEELKGVKTYDPELGGILSVWKDPADGKTYVVNGHNRLGLANRAQAPEVATRYLDAPDANAARLKGAMINIAEGRGTAIDAAKIFRENKLTPAKLEASGISLKGQIASTGSNLAKLSPAIFDRVVQGDIPVQRAALIGEMLPEYADQDAALQLLDRAEKGKSVTNDQFRELLTFVNDAPKKMSAEDSNMSLFGDPDPKAESTALEMAGMSDFIRKKLIGEKKLFGTVADVGKSKALEAAGNQLTDKNAQIAEGAGQALAVYDKLKSHSGPVNDLLRSGAESIGKGAKANEVREFTYEKIRNKIVDTLAGK